MKDIFVTEAGPDQPVPALNHAVEILKALGHTGRLAIMCELADGEKSVNMLETSLGIRQASVSQQLARLRQEGLVKHRRQGKSIYYRVASERVRGIVETVRTEFTADS